MEKIAIVDWDLHHGNGTQDCFYEEPRVPFISTHQFPHYPGTGGMRDVGYGKGEGFTVNVPMAAGANDADYLTVFHVVVTPIIEAYQPELILVSAGFDAHESDPLGGMNLTEQGYQRMVQILMHLAGKYSSAARDSYPGRWLQPLCFAQFRRDGLSCPVLLRSRQGNYAEAAFHRGLESNLQGQVERRIVYSAKVLAQPPIFLKNVLPQCTEYY